MGMDSYKYEETLGILVNMAKVKLAMNNHKGNIEELPYSDISELLAGEVTEFCEAIDEEAYFGIIEEGADIMNFLLAAIHKATKTYRERKNVPKSS